MKKEKQQKLISWLVFVVIIFGFLIHLYWVLSGHPFVTVII